MMVCKLDGAQLEGHALLLRSHGEQRDRGCRVILAGVGVGGRIESRVLVLGGGNRNKTDETPIILQGDALEDFECLMRILYPP